MRDAPGGVPGPADGLPDHRGGAGLDGLGDVGAAIVRPAGVRQEDVAGRQSPAVRAHAARFRRQRAQGFDQGVAVGRFGMRIHVDSGSTAGAAPGGALFWLKGASGGIAMKRRAPAMTRENTGAATRLP